MLFSVTIPAARGSFQIGVVPGGRSCPNTSPPASSSRKPASGPSPSRASAPARPPSWDRPARGHTVSARRYSPAGRILSASTAPVPTCYSPLRRSSNATMWPLPSATTSRMVAGGSTWPAPAPTGREHPPPRRTMRPPWPPSNPWRTCPPWPLLAARSAGPSTRPPARTSRRSCWPLPRSPAPCASPSWIRRRVCPRARCGPSGAASIPAMPPSTTPG